MATVDSQIQSICTNISANIYTVGHDRALLAQNLLSQLRNLVEALAVRLHQHNGGIQFEYSRVAPAIAWIGQGGKRVNFLRRFHNLLQMSVSHYTFEGDSSERLMLKYYEFLVRIRTLIHQECRMSVLTNLDGFPVYLDQSLKEYHEKIAERIDAIRTLPSDRGRRDRFYIHKVRPFFTKGRIFYEVTFSKAVNKCSKFDRIIGFTDIDIIDNYSANLILLPDSIRVLNNSMPIMIIREWAVSIRPCEFDNFARMLDITTKVNTGSAEYRALMHFLTVHEATLLDIIDFQDARYNDIRRSLTSEVKTPLIFNVLDSARQLIKGNKPGCNLLRYLMWRMKNQIIKEQYNSDRCGILSDLKVAYGCKPFDAMPFCTSPIRHNPRFADLTASIKATGRTHELLARRVKNNIERHGMLYTPVADLESLGQVDQLINAYNAKLYRTHTGRQLILDKNHVFIKEYEDETVSIIKELQALTKSGIAGYTQAVERWISGNPLNIDDVDKVNALKNLFSDSRIALVYGAAGTGKTTMVNYIAHYFNDKQKMFLAHTNPAKDNLIRRVSAQNVEFRTIQSHISRAASVAQHDVLIIDECSTVCNSDFLKVLQNTQFKLLVLVGDIYQIESIQFGNWFSIIRSFVPRTSVFEITNPFRTNSPGLLAFWTCVRHLADGIEELMAQNGYSAVLDQSLFEADTEDAIILCLNYDGLYGINNINRFLQSSNHGKEVIWDDTVYKVGDPILFNETNRFKRLIYNNLKGKIMDIVRHADRIQFDVSLDRAVTEFDVDGIDLKYVEDSTVRFDVHQSTNSDDDDDSLNSIVPFQIAYAVSIHKAQGLEFDSVKVVITEANEEDISHSIFYTAITRTRKHLKIFWTPETQKAVMSSLKSKRHDKDVALLKARRGSELVSA